MTTLAAVALFVVVGLALWSYFGFVYFDLDELKPASKLRRVWGLLVATTFPAFATLKRWMP
jgi:hypothetical protein